MENVMKKAWEIARNGQKKFGGKVKDYLSSSLKIAWALLKGATQDIKYYVRSDDWSIEEMFYSLEEISSFLKESVNKVSDMLSNLDPGKADYTYFKIDNTEVTIYVMKK